MATGGILPHRKYFTPPPPPPPSDTQVHTELSTHKSSNRKSRRMMAKVKALQSMLSVISCFLFPPHLPQQRQQQKHRPVTQNAMPAIPPMMVTMMRPIHQLLNYTHHTGHVNKWHTHDTPTEATPMTRHTHTSHTHIAVLVPSSQTPYFFLHAEGKVGSGQLTLSCLFC